MARATLTELEGAVLIEVAYRGNDTAYKVRRAFQASFSVQWRGSAGAVSPAVKRLEERCYLASAPHPTRDGKILKMTSIGRKALKAWLEDVELASGAGMDPFRLRAGSWKLLSKNEQVRLFNRARIQIVEEIAKLEARDLEDLPDEVQTKLCIKLLKSRLDWLTEQ